MADFDPRAAFLDHVVLALRDVVVQQPPGNVDIGKVHERLRRDPQISSATRRSALVAALHKLGCHLELRGPRAVGVIRDSALEAVLRREITTPIFSAEPSIEPTAAERLAVSFKEAVRRADRAAQYPHRFLFKDVCARLRVHEPAARDLADNWLGRYARREAGLTLKMTAGYTWVMRDAALARYIGMIRQPVR